MRLPAHVRRLGEPDDRDVLTVILALNSSAVEPQGAVLAGDVDLDVGLAGRAEPLDRLHRRAELVVVDPDRLDPHADADLVDRALLDEVHDREVGAVEQDERRHVRASPCVPP